MHLHEIVKIDAAAFIGLVCDVLKLFSPDGGNRPGEMTGPEDLNRAGESYKGSWGPERQG